MKLLYNKKNILKSENLKFFKLSDMYNIKATPIRCFIEKNFAIKQ